MYKIVILQVISYDEVVLLRYMYNTYIVQKGIKYEKKVLVNFIVIHLKIMFLKPMGRLNFKI